MFNFFLRTKCSRCKIAIFRWCISIIVSPKCFIVVHLWFSKVFNIFSPTVLEILLGKIKNVSISKNLNPIFITEVNNRLVTDTVIWEL